MGCSVKRTCKCRAFEIKLAFNHAMGQNREIAEPDLKTGCIFELVMDTLLQEMFENR